MSDASIQFRKPTSDERRLLSALIKRASFLTLSPDWMDQLEVADMSDEGMGSLRLKLTEYRDAPKVFSRKVSELQFADLDGVIVLASLNVDPTDRLFELDVWKSDFSPLVRVPAYIEDVSL